MNLVIDQGNTNTKLASFQDKELLKKIELPTIDLDKIQDWIHTNEFDAAIISSVAGEELNCDTKSLVRFDHETPIPIKNKYESPETLGLDRLANAVAAWSKNPSKNSLVIDIGTCVKYDIVSADGEYLGGNISPGMEMRYKSLHHFTHALPNLSYNEKRGAYGIDTKTSITEGVQQGMLHEIKGFIQRYRSDFQHLTIFMTGGDIKYFDLEFKNSIFADPNFTLLGLNEILSYNDRS